MRKRALLFVAALTWASAVLYAQSVQPPPDPPGTIYGSKNPEKISTYLTYNIFFRIAACAENASEAQRRVCKLVRRRVGLAPDDEQQLEIQLDQFLAAANSIDTQLAEVAKLPVGDPHRKALLRELLKQRRKLVVATVGALRQGLSPQGAQQLESYVVEMKKNVKMAPVKAKQS